MNEMVERVARAISVADHFDPDAAAVFQPNGTPVKHWELRESLARAAIEAMREPTAQMLDVMSPVDDGDPLDVARANWQAGIDAALK